MRRSNDRSFLPIAGEARLLPGLLPGNPRNERNCISEGVNTPIISVAVLQAVPRGRYRYPS